MLTPSSNLNRQILAKTENRLFLTKNLTLKEEKIEAQDSEREFCALSENQIIFRSYSRSYAMLNTFFSHRLDSRSAYLSLNHRLRG